MIYLKMGKRLFVLSLGRQGHTESHGVNRFNRTALTPFVPHKKSELSTHFNPIHFDMGVYAIIGVSHRKV